MIPQSQLNKRANRLYSDIKTAKIYIDDDIVDGVIQKKTIDENIVKVFIGMTARNGTIKKIEVYDANDDILQIQEMNIVKNDKYKFLAVVEIRVESEALSELF